MIYFYTWENETILKKTLNKWSDTFIEKFWDFNYTNIENPYNIEPSILKESMISGGFLWEKKLIIINNIPWDSQDKDEKIEELIIENLENIPEENFVVFVSKKPDKRWKLYKKLLKTAEIKKFENYSWIELINFLENRYWEIISRKALQKLVSYKWENMLESINECEKLCLYKDSIDERDIDENISENIDDSVFKVCDLLLEDKKNLAIDLIRKLSEKDNIYMIYNAILSSLRTTFYIEMLKNRKVNLNEISVLLDLQKRSFLVNKRYKLNFDKIKWLYSSLIEIDKKMKSWFFLESTDEAFLYEIETSILKN